MTESVTVQLDGEDFEITERYMNWKFRDNFIDLSHYTKTRMHVKKRIKIPKWWLE